MKEKIILSTIDHLIKDGLKFNIDKISKELNISKKTIYKYFSTKEELANEVFDYYYKNLKEEIMSKGRIDSKETIDYLERSLLLADERLFNKFNLNELAHKLILNYTKEIENLLISSLPITREKLYIVSSALRSLVKEENEVDKEEIKMELSKLWTL